MTAITCNYTRENPLVISWRIKQRIEDEHPDLVDVLYRMCKEGRIVVIPESRKTRQILFSAEHPLVISPETVKRIEVERPGLFENLRIHCFEGVVVVKDSRKNNISGRKK